MAGSLNAMTTEVFGYRYKINFINEIGRGAFRTVYKDFGQNNYCFGKENLYRNQGKSKENKYGSSEVSLPEGQTSSK